MKVPAYKPGDWVVYRKPKRSTRPGPRAKSVHPARRGEEYTYVVDKFWLVVDALEDEIVVQTRRGKRHVLAAASSNLRRAGWWDLLVNRHRFPQSTSATGA
ncbi:MAG: hypothetical protein DWQ31_06540 [Planctomycetota bacterium]|nr:MAG: hypothetical protein DWQ31_06540 [Planctomycetota bacterium]REJ91505.1 MAG: hypothetical protein DWQ35_14275 [Planctomycetota bacterium]REK26948.1 MAG: hypothetical protein DWQ42_07750 [Planctomycetota bacterium]REK44374.1 MAG: hypothetical protein DWQ46_09935 [Planctomycetota bacterium]